ITDSRYPHATVTSIAVDLTTRMQRSYDTAPGTLGCSSG
ncbi:hypothetical protein Pcinc_029192, partial [Petrolisthes cinctipes]